jgi:ribosomal protein S18 acetylase RimI-like enzyme
MNLRFATLEDFPDIERLLRLYLAEQEDGGSVVRFTLRTLDAHRDMIRQYLTGQMLGIVRIAEDEEGNAVGFGYAGEDHGPCPYDTTLGKVANVWVMWVAEGHRKQGAALEMLTSSQERFAELGFDTAMMTVREGNEEGLQLSLAFGAQPLERILYFRRGEPYGQRKRQ